MKPTSKFGRAFLVIAVTTLAFAVQAQTNAPSALAKPAAKAAPKRAAAPEFKLVLEPRAIELVRHRRIGIHGVAVVIRWRGRAGRPRHATPPATGAGAAAAVSRPTASRVRARYAS